MNLSWPAKFRIRNNKYKEDSGGWRKDIDGLRALAVISVVLFHFDPRLLPSGFLGVDVFFVISGFLITKILLNEKIDGPRDVFGFYERRIRRIFPSLLAVFAISSIVFSWFLVPGVHQDFFMTAIASFFGVSNLYLSVVQVDYFAQDSNLNPFLHSWSVGVELQFYLVFGAMFMMLKSKVKDEGKLRVALLGVAFFGVIISFIYSRVGPGQEYFGFLGRWWEFMLGVGAFLLLPYASEQPGKSKELISIFAFLVLVGVLFVAEEAMPGYARHFIACSAASVFLAFGSSRQWGGLVLENTLARGVGKISFSLYLVHFPALKLFEYYFDTAANDFMSLVLYLASILVLGVLAFSFFEKPFLSRSFPVGGGRSATRKAVYPYFVFSLSVLLAALYVVNPNASMARELGASLARPEVKPTLEGALGEVVVFGDSHAQQLFPAYEKISQEKNIKFVNKTGTACFFAEDVFYVRVGTVERRCKEHLRKTMDWLRRSPNSGRVLLVATRSLYYISPVLISESDVPVEGVLRGGRFYPAEKNEAQKVFFESLEATVKSLSAAGVKVVYMAPIPEMLVPTYRCAFNPQKRECQTSRSLNQGYREDFMRELRSLDARYPGLTVWDPFDKICQGSVCGNFYRGQALYRDDDHLTLSMAESLAEDLWVTLDKAMNRSGHEPVGQTVNY